MSLQGAVWAREAQGEPPHDDGVTTARVRVIVALEPHVSVHTPQPPQFETMQSVGQHSWLQVRDSVRTGQSSPPQ